MRFRYFVLAAAILALAGCAGRPKGVLVPMAVDVPGTTKVDILVATTRSPDGAPSGEMFTGERGRKLAFADIAVSLPPDSTRSRGDIQWPKSMPPNPATDFVTVRAESIDRAEALKRFTANLKKIPQHRVLVFVHGYNTRFEEAVYRLAQISHDSGAPALPVLFTWPSRGRLLAYTYDRESANFSRDGLEALLQALVKDKNVGEIAILAHSMGNWVTLEALRQMAIRDRGLPRKINSVMLAAPDVDFDVFRRQIAEIGPNRPPFTVFVSRDDSALAVSQRVWGNLPRVGAIDPNAEPFHSELAAEKLMVIDLTNVQSSDRLNHGTFAQAPEVVQLIGQRLVEGQTLNDGSAGLGDKLGSVAMGAASTVGSAASIAISAPIAIIDPKTREGLGDQFEELGQHMSQAVPLPKGGTTAHPSAEAPAAESGKPDQPAAAAR